MDRPYGISDFAFPSRWDRESGPDLAERVGQGSRPDREQSQIGRGKGSNSTRSRGGFDRPVTIYRGRDREYSLRESEVRTVTDLGRFRVVPEGDLARFGYQGNRTQMESDIRSLTRQDLVERRITEGHSSYSTKALTLTKDGHSLLERARRRPRPRRKGQGRISMFARQQDHAKLRRVLDTQEISARIFAL
jgi:hypothetical protein